MKKLLVSPHPGRLFVLAATVFCCHLAPAQSPPSSASPGSAARLHEAILAAQSGDGAKALRLTTSLLATSPNYEPALKFEGALFEDMGQPQQAEAAFRKAFVLAPYDSELMLKVGIYDLVAGDSKRAIALLTRRLKFAPHDRDALYYLAQAYHLTGENDLALRTIKAAIKEDPQNPALWQKYGELLCSSGDAATALKWLTKAQSADPTLKQIDLDLAVASFNNQDLDNALKSATSAVEHQPTDPHALALLGSVDVKLAHWQDAEAIFQRLLALKSDDTSSLLGLGHAELELKNYQLAADSLERALQQDPTLILAHFYLSRAYAALGKTEDAEREALLHRKMLEQGASLAPGGQTAQQKATIDRARRLLADNYEAEALQLVRDPQSGFSETPASAYGLVGALYISMNRPDDAVRCLNKALSLDPAARGAHTDLGILALQQSEFDRAENEFNQELAAHPNDQMATAEIGEVRYRQGRWSEAADRIAQSKTAVPYLLYMLADSYFHLGKPKDADITAELVVDYSRGDREMLARVIDLLNRNQQSDFAQQLSRKAASASIPPESAIKQ
jgi:Tfp pilus assembly protein PilF